MVYLFLLLVIICMLLFMAACVLAFMERMMHIKATHDAVEHFAERHVMQSRAEQCIGSHHRAYNSLKVISLENNAGSRL
jgi:hypothetical protein